MPWEFKLRTQWLVPAIIFLISFCLHLSLISKGPFSVDCLALVINSQATLVTHHLHYQWGSGYPLMVLLGSTFIALGKYIGITDPVLAVNLIGVVFSSIAVLAFYLLVQEISDTLTAILASFILLLNPIFLDVSTYGINHAPALCFLLLGFLSLLRFQSTGKFSDLLLSALYLGFMGATRLQDFILTLPAIVFMFLFGLKDNPSPGHHPKAQNFLLFTTTIIVIIILFHLPYFISQQTDYANQAEDFWKIGLTKNFLGLFSSFLIGSLWLLVWTFKITGISCCATGLFYMAVFNKRLLIFTILWWMVPFSFYGNIKSVAPRFFTIILPALIIPMSLFLAHMLRHKKTLWKLLALIAFLMIIIRPLLHTHEIFIRRHHYALISDYYRWVGKSTEPDATIISSDDGSFITYYSKRKTLGKPAHAGHLLPKELTDFKKALDNILNDRKQVYITRWAFVDYDDYQEFKNLMFQNYHLIHVGQMPLEFWYQSPYSSNLYISSLIEIEKKN